MFYRKSSRLLALVAGRGGREGPFLDSWTVDCGCGTKLLVRLRLKVSQQMSTYKFYRSLQDIGSTGKCRPLQPILSGREFGSEY